jgi:hypothetical protein
MDENRYERFFGRHFKLRTLPFEEIGIIPKLRFVFSSVKPNGSLGRCQARRMYRAPSSAAMDASRIEGYHANGREQSYAESDQHAV